MAILIQKQTKRRRNYIDIANIVMNDFGHVRLEAKGDADDLASAGNDT